jgi:hypothetical protein
MVFIATFNNMSAISRRSVLLAEEIGETTDLPQVIAKFYHIMLQWFNTIKIQVSELVWYKADISIISSNATCSCHDIAEQLLFSLAHSGTVSFPRMSIKYKFDENDILHNIIK